MITVSESTRDTLRIDMVSDVVCPWCIIGYKKLEQALMLLKQRQPQLNVSLNFQPFQLNPQMPREGQNVNEHIAEKYGADPTTIAQNRARIQAVAKELGVEFNTSEKSRIYNTFLAHKLLHIAKPGQQQLALKLALFDAYFTRQQDVSDPQVLKTLALEVGLDAGVVERALDDESVSHDVQNTMNQYIQAGISAVPTFVINRRYSISGAQETEILLKAMEDILSENAA